MKIKHLLLVCLLGLVALGCGGGGDSSFNGSGGTTGANNATVPVFATDVPSKDFAHVWVTIYSIDLVSSTGSTVNVFSSTTGLTVDVRSLHDSGGQLLQFISAAAVPAGTYSSAKLTLGNSVTIVQNGQNNSTTYQFANANSAGSGKALFTVPLNPAFQANGSNPLVLDFLLSNWSINAQNQVVATITLGKGHVTRQHSSQLEGVVSGLTGTAGSQSFTLQLDHNRTVTVMTTANTTIFNADGSPNPALANGERVHATGTYSNGTFTATSIKIQKGQVGNHTVDVTGTFANLNATSATFTLTVQDTDDFAPGTIVVNVVTNTNTQYLLNGVSENESDFFNSLSTAPAGSQVEVQGTISGNTLTASVIRLLPSGSGTPQSVEIDGKTSNVNATNGTFTLTANGWDGISLSNGATVNVSTSTNTYFNLNGQQVTQAQWFAALTPQTEVKTFGLYNNGALTAGAVVIGTDNDGEGHKHHHHGDQP